jgi:hypothetical protein
MRKHIGTLLAALVLAVPAGAQTSTVVDFHEYASPVTREYEAAIGYPLTAGGLDFYQTTAFDANARNVLGTWGYADAGAVNRPVNIGNSTTLYATLATLETDIYAAGSDLVFGRYAPFTLRSIDVAHVYNSAFAAPFALAPINFRIFGFGASGVTFFQDFLIPLPPVGADGTRTPVLQTLTLNSNFQDAYNVWFLNGATSGTSVQFTNLDVTVSPEPGSLALMGTGLFGVIGFATRRRKRTLAS